MFVLIFSTTFVWNICYSKNNWVQYNQQDRQCMCNITLRHICATIHAVEEQ